jgi:hypothetical protein
VVAPGRGGHDCLRLRTRILGLRRLAVLAGFSELRPQIARDVPQTALGQAAYPA